MKLEDQVASLELSKKLKELGVKQESAFRWVWCNGCHLHEGKNDPGLCSSTDFLDSEKEFVAAFTVAELGEMLPATISFPHRGEDRQWELFCGKDDSPFCGYFNAQITHHGLFEFQEYADTEADARAKMLILLIEKGIVKPTDQGGAV